MSAAFEAAEKVVSRYFAERGHAPERGTIEVQDERYVLVRSAALSVEFFTLVRGLYGDDRTREADEFARNILFDLAHAIGKADARNFHAKMKLVDPIERLSAGPVHFAHAGWAFVEISPESRPTPDEDFYLLYDHPYSFEASAWLAAKRPATFPVCVMNAGYSSGWCQESFGVSVVASEILCRARGDDVCRFVMAHPHRIEARVAHYHEARPGLARRDYQIPDFFARKRIEEELRQSRDELEARVLQRTAELEEANRRLLQAQKLEAVGRLAGGIAHDFNNLLGLILLRTGLLQSRTSPSDPVWQELDQICAACHRGAALSRQLLAFSRRQPMARQPVELGGFVRQLLSSLLPLVGEDIEVVTSIAGEAHIEGDRSQLEQVLMNLVVNARDAMPNGGTLRIGVDVVTLGDTTVTTGKLAAGSYARLSVADNGSGMDADTMVHIFEPFFTTKSEERGTGLGLSTVYGIAKQAGGEIAVQSAPGRGTTFTVYLPVSPARSRADASAQPKPAPAAAQLRVLLVEDQDELRNTIARALTLRGHDVVSVGAADAALAVLEHASSSFDVVITDIVMPRVSGREVAEKVRARWPGLRVLFMSGYDSDVLGATHDGPPVLRKPFTMDELNRRIVELVARA